MHYKGEGVAKRKSQFGTNLVQFWGKEKDILWRSSNIILID